MPDIDTYEEAKKYLYGLKYHGAKYGIERMLLFSEALCHPERQYSIIHVAGTNGKGSTCAMIEAIYRHAGYKTGLFTSPHLVYQGERIQVNRRPLEKNDIVAYTRELKEQAEALARKNPEDHPSFFEFITAMAFSHFAREKIDVAIVETGLGGRLDATNVLTPEISIISSISLDHCEMLGDTLQKIAAEKGGIIKAGRPVALGHLPPEAESVLRDRAGELDAPVHTIREHFGDDLDSYPVTNLAGKHQRWNAAVATIAANLLKEKFPLRQSQITEALRDVNWPARWEKYQLGSKTLILDNAHNPESAEMLAANLDNLLDATGRKPIIMVGTMGQFRARALLPVIARYASEILLLKPSQPRASSFEELQREIPASYKGPVRREQVINLFPFPGYCAAGEPDDVLVATGSIYLIGEILEAMKYEHPLREHSLQDAP